MTLDSRSLELLAPAKNAEYGREAILHGADAVYIGGPSFGARANAGNSIADIESLAGFAHRYNARVLVAVNTLLRDDELEAARQLAWQAWDAGADALIIQDMGLTMLDLPPIALHASTQCDIRTPEKARFLQAAGFSQLVLARELSLEQIRAIAANTDITLEAFIHGALCVSYSGLCNLSHARTGRSANRGDCSQPCRLRYSLFDAGGTPLATDKHLLSIKDNDQRDNLQALIDAGIRSFKIEGRLKDLAYVKNVTAFYRQRIDALLDGDSGKSFHRSASGRCVHRFIPAPEKTFNRGRTDYFVHERHADLGAFDSPKFVGEPLGVIRRITRTACDLETDATLNNGDGITFFDAKGELVGARINTVEAIPGGFRLAPALSDGRLPAGLVPGTRVFRNHDQAFLRLLEKPSADRRIPIILRLEETDQGLVLYARDERGVEGSATHALAYEPARDTEAALVATRDALARLGATPYVAERIELPSGFSRFVPTSIWNALRRAAVESLDLARAAAWVRPPRRPVVEPPVPYPDDALGYLGNVCNASARSFYERHGVRIIDSAFECHEEKGDVSLMITRHCLRYSFNLCPKEVRGIRPDPMILMNGKDRLTLRFDCKACEMHVVGRLRTGRSVAIASRPADEQCG